MILKLSNVAIFSRFNGIENILPDVLAFFIMYMYKN